MASEVHAASPQKNISLINEQLVYNTFSKNELNLQNLDFVSFEESKAYSHCNQTSGAYGGYLKNSQVEATKIPITLTLLPHQAIVNNNNMLQNYEEEIYQKMRNCICSPQQCESDESCISYSSIETSENRGAKLKHLEKKATADHDCYRPCIFQPNLYQPNVHYSKNSKYFRGTQRPKCLKNSEETEKKVHGLMRRFQSRAYKMKIVINPQILLNGGPWDPLNQAMWDVFVNKIQKEETYIRKLNLWKEIFIFFKMCLSNYGLYLVGSTMSGFAIEGSDIDICLLTRPCSNEPRMDSFHHLNYLQHALLKNGIASEAELIMAKVPILKFKNKETGFDVDLNCNNIVGVQNTHLLYSYTQMDWRVRPLVVIVKIWAQANNINDAKNMTISSYSWTLMVIHYLQCGVFPPVLPCLHNLYPGEFNSHENRTMDVQGEIEGLKDFESENKRCLGDLLIVRAGSRLPVEMCKQVKSPKNDPHQWKFLCIEEPFDLSNTAKSVFDLEVFKQIKHVIISSYKELACNKSLSHILPVTDLNGKR